jgi:hypothetical protein
MNWSTDLYNEWSTLLQKLSNQVHAKFKIYQKLLNYLNLKIIYKKYLTVNAKNIIIKYATVDKYNYFCLVVNLIFRKIKA